MFDVIGNAMKSLYVNFSYRKMCTLNLYFENAKVRSYIKNLYTV